jgi:CHAT domain-containing protein
MRGRRHGVAGALLMGAVALALPNAWADDAPLGFVPPPRSIADITSTLDHEKPDAGRIAKLQARANADVGQQSGKELATFYFERGRARGELGRFTEAVDDTKRAIAIGEPLVSAAILGRYMQFLSQQYSAAGDPVQALAANRRQLEISKSDGARGYALGANLKIAQIYLQMGDLDRAAAAVGASDVLIEEARNSPAPGWRSAYAIKGEDWESMVASGHAMIAEARGQFQEAERAYRETERRKASSIDAVQKLENRPSESSMRTGVDGAVLSQARMKARQGRLAEAEVDARRALMSRLRDLGKYNAVTVSFIRGFAGILIEQGRFEEAGNLTRTAIDINRTLGVPDSSLLTVELLSQLGSLHVLNQNPEAAASVYADLDRAMEDWEPARREAFEISGSRITALYASKRVEAGIDAAERLIRRSVALVGNDHVDTAAARGLLAQGLMQANRDAEALAQFRAALPVMLLQARENRVDDDAVVVAARDQQLRSIAESYFALLARTPGIDAGRESFAIADAVRAGSVQRAIAASSARSAAADPTLSAFVRRQQDLSKQLGAALGALNNALSLPAADRDPQMMDGLNARVAALRADEARAQADLASAFPAYADLVSPQSPSVAAVQDVLAADEAMISIYVGRHDTFIWAFGKTGPVAFASTGLSSDAVAARVKSLRAALEPQAAMISDIPVFDVAAAHDLYRRLLGPVETGWRPAKSLIVATNGALGLLPLSLLPTAPASVSTSDEPLFASYRAVPWLARTHAVSAVPSAAALRTLRQLPPGRGDRQKMVGFGDPIFAVDQLDHDEAPAPLQVASASASTRGAPLRRRNSPVLDGVDSASLEMLPRLPDTALELDSIARALDVDPQMALFLGKAANEQAVKDMDLSSIKLLVFATHGLVPGELDGLTQPALALSSPRITGLTGDGLLTTSDILGLKLDADWVVLSACNTGAGAGAGAEAASGLGRAFFYAGTRALLVTNWSVHSQSARELMSDLFRRQGQNESLSRGEALRQAMMALVDGDGFKGEDGATVFSYAHPLFWAPYTLIGDGGGH